VASQYWIAKRKATESHDDRAIAHGTLVATIFLEAGPLRGKLVDGPVLRDQRLDVLERKIEEGARMQ